MKPKQQRILSTAQRARCLVDSAQPGMGDKRAASRWEVTTRSLGRWRLAMNDGTDEALKWEHDRLAGEILAGWKGAAMEFMSAYCRRLTALSETLEEKEFLAKLATLNSSFTEIASAVSAAEFLGEGKDDNESAGENPAGDSEAGPASKAS